MDLYALLRGLVYAQSLIFIWLFRKKNVDSFFNKNIRTFFYFSSLYVICIIYIFNINYNFYTTDLLIYYCLSVLFVTLIFESKYSFKNALCYGFLIVFINSYYWESMLHLNKIIAYGLNLNDVIQGLHLYTAYLFYKEIEVTNIKRFKKYLLYGLIVSNLNILIRNILPINIYYMLGGNGVNNYITRIICLCLLTKNIYDNTIKKEK